MSYLPLDAAATRLGVARETIEDWIQRGLLTVHAQTVGADVPSGGPGSAQVVRCVEEEQLCDVAESLGWLEMSAEHWDDGEED
jgi:hypothetical protein